MYGKTPFKRVYANSIDAFIPQLWARESLAILVEEMVIANLVNQDFSSTVATLGETVNTRRPGEFEAVRKGVTDDVTVQDATATNVAVVLNQHIHTSFLIRDGEESKSMADLIKTYLRPAMQAQARAVDQILLGQMAQFLENSKGGLGLLTSSNGKDYILDTREIMNTNKAYPTGRNLIVTPSAETELLKMELFVAADKVGDNGTALREASLGKKLGFDFYMSQNMTSTRDLAMTKKSGAINLTAGYVAGDLTLTVDGFTGAVTTGSFITIAGDDTPLRVSAHTETLGNTVEIVLTGSGLRKAVANNAVINAYTPGAVNLVAGYAAGWYKAIVIDTLTVAPQVGQLIAFGTGSAVYTVIGTPTLTSIVLDRPLEAAIVNDAIVAVGPPGQYNFAFHKDALALVIRPLATPVEGSGARTGSASYNGLTMRVVITYDGTKQGHLVTLDFLMGTKVLNSDLGALMLG